MRRIVLLASLLVAMPAFAQVPLTPGPASAPPSAPAGDGMPSTPARPGHARHTQAERFAAANTTHDGHLTLEQARAGHMGAVVRDFAAIDKDSSGSVTLAQIRDYRRAHRGQNRATQG